MDVFRTNLTCKDVCNMDKPCKNPHCSMNKDRPARKSTFKSNKTADTNADNTARDSIFK